jgi:exopolyphosphatase/guanosine-5'-triphosphate,3'-diphosphate pyrophosphatase
VRWQLDRLWALPLAERRQIAGLPKNRADVILTGVAIYEAVMEQFGFSELRVSTRGLRFAAVMEADPAEHA